MPERSANDPKESLSTKKEFTDRERKPQREVDHPEEYQEDLNPRQVGSQNVGPESTGVKQGDRTAHDVKDLHERFPELTDDVLRAIPIVPEGARLEEGATYIDLRDEPPEAFTAMGDEETGRENLYVSKKMVAYEIWNHLIGEEKPGQELG